MKGGVTMDERRAFTDETQAARDAWELMTGDSPTDRDCDIASAAMERVDTRGWTEDDKTAWDVVRGTLDDLAAGAADLTDRDVVCAAESLAARYGFSLRAEGK
jgi:hypothetical protein